MGLRHYSSFMIIALSWIVLYSGCIEKECETITDCAHKTCSDVGCTGNKCVYTSISDCCGNEKCEPGETYEDCVSDCPNCDDKDGCTVDEYDYHEQKCVNTPILDVVCCGNGICELGETYSNCTRDCLNCDDDKECTKDTYDYHAQKCINEPIIPCCGNGICETGETYKECADDCVKSGVLNKDELWGGTIHVTGDIDVVEGVTLTILPGTVIKVALTDDQHKGRDEPMTDIYFPKDPPFYEKEKITIHIFGTLNTIETSDNRIIFTSISENPTTYDWWGINIVHGRLEYAIVEYGQGNIQLQHGSNVVIANNIIRNGLGCCIGIDHSNQVSPQILNNDIYNCGHEGIDLAGGSAIIKGNYFYLGDRSLQPDPPRGGLGIVVYKNTYPTIENNVFEKLTTAIYFHGNSKYPEEQGKSVILKNNRIENNRIAFNIDSGYLFEVVVKENNELINNGEDEVHIG